MSWFLSEGEKLEQKEKWEKAAWWYEEHKQFDDALRCWKEHYGFAAYFKIAQCLERYSKYLEAAEYYLYKDNYPNKPEPRDQISGAVRCYKAAKSYEKGAKALMDACYGGDDDDFRAYAFEGAGELYIEGKMYKEAFWALFWGHRHSHCRKMIDIFMLIKEELPQERFVEFIRELWGQFETACSCAKDRPFDFLHETLGAVFQITDSLGTDPFVNDIVHSFVDYIISTEYIPEFEYKKGWSLKECSEMLRGWRPQLAIEFCQYCLRNKLLPLPLPQSKKISWEDCDKEPETVWLIQLSNAYINADEQEKAVEVYTSRYRFGEAAEVLEYLDRFEESVALLEKSGAANYRTRDTSWDKQIIDPLVRERLWKEKIAQLKGKIGATEHLKKPEEKPSMPSIDELEKMLALGEITQEEFERKSESANPMP